MNRFARVEHVVMLNLAKQAKGEFLNKILNIYLRRMLSY